MPCQDIEPDLHELIRLHSQYSSLLEKLAELPEEMHTASQLTLFVRQLDIV